MSTTPVLEAGALDDGASLSAEAWWEMGKALGLVRAQAASSASRQMWEVGDWLAIGEREVHKHLTRARVREMASSITGYSRHTLTMAASVARKIAPSMRIDGLSWWHHLVVAKLEPTQMTDWLTRAAEEGWSVKTLRGHLCDIRRDHRASQFRCKRIVSELVKFRREELPKSAAAELQEWWRREMR